MSLGSSVTPIWNHFHNTDSSDPRTWYNVYTVFGFFHQCLIVFLQCLTVFCIISHFFFVYSSLLFPLDRFISRYFTRFVAMVNVVDSLISLCDFSLLMHTNARDFCVFILYPVTLLNSLISSSNFLIESLGFFPV